MEAKPFLETDNPFVVASFTFLSITGATEVVIWFLYDAIVHGAYIGAYLPFFLTLPFLLFGRVVPEEHRGVLQGQVARLHLLLWLSVVLYLRFITVAGLQYPTTAAERITALCLALVVSAVLFIGTGAGTWKVIRSWPSCRATLRAIWRLLSRSSLEQITNRCIRWERMPTAEEQQAVLMELAQITDDDAHLASAAANSAIAERACAYTERIEGHVRSIRENLECMRLVTRYTAAVELQSAVEERIAQVKAEITRGERS